MAIGGKLTFISSGKPARPEYNPKISRDASRRGIIQSGATDNGDFKELIQQKNSPAPQEIGRQAGDIQRRFQSGKGIKIDIEA